MSRIRSKDTKPEIFVRQLLFSSGFRYRLHTAKLPGHPDVVLPKWKVAVFVNGCFWHSHRGCQLAAKPKTNKAFWLQKLELNQRRDERIYKEIQIIGWRILIVWECACRKKYSSALKIEMDRFIKSADRQSIHEIGRRELV